MSFVVLSAIIAANSLFSTYINCRQYQKLGEKMPETAIKIYTQETWSRSVQYSKEKLIFHTLSEIVDSCKDILHLLYLEPWHLFFARRFTNPAVPFVFSYLITNQIFKIPFSAFSDFVIERRYGFNKKTLKVFVTDIFIMFLLTLCIGWPFLFTSFHIISKFSNFEIFLGGFIVVFQLFMMWIYPVVIAPLYNKFTPLEDQSLKKNVEELAAKVGFKVGKIEVMDGSKRSGHSNAYFVGFGRTKKIVFYNTILEQLNESETIAVLAHELGHWHYSHIIQLLIVGWAETFGYIFAFKMFVAEKSSQTIAISLLKFIFAASSVSVPLMLLTHSINRMFEKQADRFAVDQGYGNELKAALLKLHTENMAMPVVDWLYSAVGYSHPHVFERLEFIDQAMKKKE
ncbi:uncharacterized protein VICG_01348 [Vittaforma corneae ATCC 50505]|uniref:CAAX prenyl protease n=1 Tax=Vittaforma corneae (strain ATCC 50505) TaxID=993615 RepID=L2GM98_VITCO|nr:uncharacterized protein VICG_01348 [Vittaforma corneae ATCC 50505]ELA41600.1 hypothetical protein VICG_01348 [Vittaforma corneae ATCC 50505]